jgi:WD40 repeat protein
MNADQPADALKIDPAQTHAAGEYKYTAPLLACRFDPSGQHVFFTAQDNTIQRYELASGKVTSLAAHDSWVRALAFHPSGSTLYSGGCEGRVNFWPLSAEAPQPKRSIEAHQGWVRALAVSPDGKLLASSGNDRLVKIWNALDGTQLGECLGHASHVYSVAFHRERGTLVSGDLKGIVREWDIATGEELRQLDATALWKYDPSFHADMGGVRGADFSSDGKLLACGGVTNSFGGVYNPAVQVFDFTTCEKKPLVTSKAKLKGVVSGIRYHRDGFIAVATYGADGGQLLFLKPEGPNEFFALKLPDVARDLDLHPDQARLATPHADHTLRLWKMTAKVG